MLKFVEKYIYILLLAPIVSYLIYTFTPVQPHHFYRVLTILVFFYVLINSKRIEFPKYLYFLVAYIIYLFLWDMYNYSNDSELIFEVIRKEHLETLAFILIIENSRISSKVIEKSYFLIKATIFFGVLFSIYQLLVDPHFFLPHDLDLLQQFNSIYEARRTSIFGYVDLNATGLSLLPLLAIFLSYSSLKQDKQKLIFILMGAIIVFATNSRYVMAGFLIVLTQLALEQKHKFYGLLKYVFSFSIITAFIAYFSEFIGYDLMDYYSERLFKEQTFDQTTRYLAWVTFQNFFGENWFTGTGVHLTDEIIYFINGRSSQIHVGYFSHLVSYGIIGSFLLFGFWYKILRNFYRTAKLTGYYGSLFAFLVFLWANATLVFYPIFTYGLIIAFVFDKYFRDLNRSESFERILTNN